MRIAYIISTCAKYFDTRVKYQMESFLRRVPRDDIYYLTSQPDLARRHFGWGAMDDAQSITWKYIHFFVNMDLAGYDWCMFIDDDTYVFVDRLEALLRGSSTGTPPAYLGHQLTHVSRKFCAYMSGGAGYVMSHALYTRVREYVRRIGADAAYYPIINLKEQFCDDLCVGLWVEAVRGFSGAEGNIGTHDPRFHVDASGNDPTAITWHKITTAEQFAKLDAESASNNTSTGTAVVLVADQKYLQPLIRTLADLRCITRGNWAGDIVVITLSGLILGDTAEYYRVQTVSFAPIDKTRLLAAIGPAGFPDSVDGRELKKLNQWEKLHVFDDYFRKWRRIVYFDAGMRIFDDINTNLLGASGRILAPRDGRLFETPKPFRCQLAADLDCVPMEDTEYMLNCVWIYDTAILDVCNKAQLIEAMNAYPVCRTNEMGIMNIMFNYKHHLWTRLPIKNAAGKCLFDWCELNQPGTTWRDYCMLKYSLKFNGGTG